MPRTSSSSLTSSSSSSPTNSENEQQFLETEVMAGLLSAVKEEISPSRNEREKYYYFGRHHRKKFHYCGDCLYRAYHRKQLSNHVKKRHPSSTTALPPLRIPAPKKTRKSKRLNSLKKTYDGSFNPRQNRGIAKLSCPLCGFRTNFPHRIKAHRERHRKKFDHQCTLCSFSAKRKRDVHSHMKNQHEKASANQGQEWYYPPNGGQRMRIVGCGECNYKTPYRIWLVKHVEKEHPLSTTALPPSKYKATKAKPGVLRCTECEYKTKEKRDFERHELYHREKSAFQCPWCSFSVDVGNKLARHVSQYHTKLDKKAPAVYDQSEPSTSIGSKKNDSDEEEKWHYFPSGHRKRYKLCGDCNYKTTTNLNLDRHIKIVHPFSTTALKPKATIMLRCSFGCEFETRTPSALIMHETCHKNKSAHKCRLCSYSVKCRENQRGHLKRHHQGNRTDQNAIELVGTNSTAPEKKKDESVSTTHSPLDRKPRIVHKESHRFRFICCGDCDYKTISRFTLTRHVKRKHPLSSSALPPLSIKRKRTLRVQRPPEENGSEVDGDDQMDDATTSPIVGPVPEGTDDSEVQEVARVSASASKREEWYYPPHGKRRTRYIYCEDCDYRTTDRYYLNQHVKTIHPSSTTAIPAQPPRVVGPSLQRCAECSYKTPHKRLFSEHEAYHCIKSEHQCHLCSFSVDCKTQLTYHWNHHHPEIEPDSFRKCSLCNFKADKEESAKRHQELHRIKSKFKCPKCSYSVKTNGNLRYHLKYHHSEESSEKEDTDEESNVRNNRKDLYEEKEGVPWKPNTFECKFCEFTTFHASRMRSHDEGHQRDLKYKCNLCSYSSDFKGIVIRHENQQHKKSITSLPVEGRDEADLELNVSANNASINEEVVPKKVIRYKCSICEYSTSESTNMKNHRNGHIRNGKFKCPYCNYSSNAQNSIGMHLKYGHHQNPKSDALPNNTPELIQVDPQSISASDIRKYFGVKECRVTLRNISSSSNQSSIRSALSKEISRRQEENPELLVDLPSNEADQTIEEVAVKLENEEVDYFEQNDQEEDTINHYFTEQADTEAVEDEKMQLLRIRIKVMKEKVRVANEEVKDISSKQRDVQKKIRKMNERKAMIEYDLRSEQCNLIEMRLLALESNEADESLSGIESIEKKVDSLESEIVEIDNELRILNEEEKELDEDLKQAEESHIGVIQVAEALQSELDAGY